MTRRWCASRCCMTLDMRKCVCLCTCCLMHCSRHTPISIYLYTHWRWQGAGALRDVAWLWIFGNVCVCVRVAYCIVCGIHPSLYIFIISCNGAALVFFALLHEFLFVEMCAFEHVSSIILCATYTHLYISTHTVAMARRWCSPRSRMTRKICVCVYVCFLDVLRATYTHLYKSTHTVVMARRWCSSRCRRRRARRMSRYAHCVFPRLLANVNLERPPAILLRIRTPTPSALALVCYM